MSWGWQQFVVAGVLTFWVLLFALSDIKPNSRAFALALLSLEVIALISAGFFK